MAFRLYIVPEIGTGVGRDSTRPKYFDGLSVVAIRFGYEPWWVAGADLSVSDDNSIVGQADAFAVPFDLSTNLTNPQVTAVKNKLEAINVPAGWVTTSLKWIEVVRSVLGMFGYMQRYGALYSQATGQVPPSIFTAGVTLSTTYGALPTAVKAAMLAAAQSFGFSTAGLTANATLRVILKALADDFQSIPYDFGPVRI